MPGPSSSTAISTLSAYRVAVMATVPACRRAFSTKLVMHRLKAFGRTNTASAPFGSKRISPPWRRASDTTSPNSAGRSVSTAASVSWPRANAR